MRRLAGIAGKILLAIAALVVAAMAWAFLTGNSRYNKHWTAHDASFPIPFPVAGADSGAALAQAIARGKHLVATRTPCMECHGKDLGGQVVVGKTAIARALVGSWAAPNLTEGEGSVTRGFTAREWDLAVRHGIRRGGRSSSMPSSEFSTLSDHELSDIVAYVRSLPPVNREMGKVRLGLIFAFVTATDPAMLPAHEFDHQKAHLVEPPAASDPTALGAHIARSCTGCHGANYAGGKMNGDPGMPLVSNLTPDATGLRAGRHEDQRSHAVARLWQEAQA